MNLRASTPNCIMNEIKSAVTEIQDRHPQLTVDQAFTFWFLRAYAVESDENEVLNAVTGQSKDKNIDACFISATNRTITLVQIKYRIKSPGKLEHRNDVMGFAGLAKKLANEEEYLGFAQSLSKEIKPILSRASRLHRNEGYKLHLYYVTLGKCSKDLIDEAGREVRYAGKGCSIEVVDFRRIEKIIKDYAEGVAPPVPKIKLPLELGNGVTSSSELHRRDDITKTESWVVSVSARAIGEIYRDAGNRIFARNVRGFLGETKINENMQDTLADEPQHFWYYNNGITIICDDIEPHLHDAERHLVIFNPQIINGQQTTRTLAGIENPSRHASVIVRVIRVPRETMQQDKQFYRLVSKIVEATNFQNAIKASDLMSNDKRQIEIERSFRGLRYLYVRKRMNKSEARASAGSKPIEVIPKEQLAQIVAACDLDPNIIRLGKETLFEKYYDRVFPVGDPFYYLSRYWAHRNVAYALRGSREGSYLKWIVTRATWEAIESLLSNKEKCRSFVHLCERDRLGEFERLANSLFQSAKRFCELEIKSSDGELDLQNIVKRKGVYAQIAKFTTSSKNPQKKRVRSALLAFRDEWNTERTLA